MEGPFIVHVNLSNVLKDQKETHYAMYIDNTKMTIVYELIEWIQWIFSLTHCVYLTHENSIIHELEDIKILSTLKNVKVQNCDHFPCVHTKLNHLLKRLNLFVQWDGIKVPKLFLNKVNEITQKLKQKDGSVKAMINGCHEEETGKPNERKIESNRTKELRFTNINTWENQLSETSNSKMFGNKADFNMNSNINLGDTVVEMDISNKVHSSSAKSEFVNVHNNNATNLNMNSNIKLYDTAVGMNNSNKVQTVLPDRNEFDNSPIKISKSEIDKINSLADIKLSTNTECNEDENINKSNRKRNQSIPDDKKCNYNKIVKKGLKPFSVGEILTSLRSEYNTLYNNCESNTFSTEQNQNYSLSNGLINDKLEFSDQNFPNNSDLMGSKIKRKRVRKHKSKKLNLGDSKLDNTSPYPKHERENISESSKLYTPYYTKPSNHIRFPSDDEEFFETNNSESNKQPEKTQHDLSKNNELVENGMQQSPLINGKEEISSVTQPSACNKNDESKVDDHSEANKEFSTLDQLILLQDEKSNSDSLFGYSNEENQEANGVPNTPDNYDFNLSTLKALKEKFPSPMVVERFY